MLYTCAFIDLTSVSNMHVLRFQKYTILQFSCELHIEAVHDMASYTFCILRIMRKFLFE